METSTLKVYDGIFEQILLADAKKNLLRAVLLIAAHRSETGVTPMSLEELPAELRSRIPASPLKGDLPRIKRNAAGIWTLAYDGVVEPVSPESEWAIQIRGW